MIILTLIISLIAIISIANPVLCQKVDFICSRGPPKVLNGILQEYLAREELANLNIALSTDNAQSFNDILFNLIWLPEEIPWHFRQDLNSVGAEVVAFGASKIALELSRHHHNISVHEGEVHYGEMVPIEELKEREIPTSNSRVHYIVYRLFSIHGAANLKSMIMEKLPTIELANGFMSKLQEERILSLAINYILNFACVRGAEAWELLQVAAEIDYARFNDSRFALEKAGGEIINVASKLCDLELALKANKGALNESSIPDFLLNLCGNVVPDLMKIFYPSFAMELSVDAIAKHLTGTDSRNRHKVYSVSDFILALEESLPLNDAANRSAYLHQPLIRRLLRNDSISQIIASNNWDIVGDFFHFLSRRYEDSSLFSKLVSVYSAHPILRMITLPFETLNKKTPSLAKVKEIAILAINHGFGNFFKLNYNKIESLLRHAANDLVFPTILLSSFKALMTLTEELCRSQSESPSSIVPFVNNAFQSTQMIISSSCHSCLDLVFRNFKLVGIRNQFDYLKMVIKGVQSHGFQDRIGSRSLVYTRGGVVCRLFEWLTLEMVKHSELTQADLDYLVFGCMLCGRIDLVKNLMANNYIKEDEIMHRIFLNRTNENSRVLRLVLFDQRCSHVVSVVWILDTGRRLKLDMSFYDTLYQYRYLGTMLPMDINFGTLFLSYFPTGFFHQYVYKFESNSREYHRSLIFASLFHFASNTLSPNGELSLFGSFSDMKRFFLMMQNLPVKKLKLFFESESAEKLPTELRIEILKSVAKFTIHPTMIGPLFSYLKSNTTLEDDAFFHQLEPAMQGNTRDTILLKKHGFPRGSGVLRYVGKRRN